MERLVPWEFNMDTACVELKFSDGSMISIDPVAYLKTVNESKPLD